jgi:hypothetical protein
VFDDWENQTRACVGHLRPIAVTTDPDAPDLTNLVGDLLVKSPGFVRPMGPL